MATTRKRTTRRKSASSAKKPLGETIRFMVGAVKKTYRRDSCGAKSELTKRADNIRAKGGTARILESSPGKYCLYKGPRKAKPKR